jgi:hypothetical protein
MKILLGKQGRESIYLTKHTWDCEWYWGMGYLGNATMHFHMDSIIERETDVNVIFTETKISQRDWWIVRDLFIQAYALKRAAEVYRHGGHQTSAVGITNCIRQPDIADKLNADLKIVLDTVWNFLTRQLIPCEYVQIDLCDEYDLV